MPTPLEQMAAFVAEAAPPDDARARALTAVIDTIGVAIAGSSEPAARIVQRTLGPDRTIGLCRIWGTGERASAEGAALANGTAAHALDYDDMCFVSLAHPSAPLVPAIVAAGELAHASGRTVLDAYVLGFEIQARLGRLINPRHYQRGWHCTSTLGVVSAAAGASRVLGLDAGRTAHALAIAASAASGLKENFGTMVKPLHAGLAARDGVVAALLAQNGFTASAQAFTGAQGYLRALDSERDDLDRETADLGTRWEIIDTGITVKLYPSCAGTHPALDAILDLRAQHRFSADDVDRIDIDVDPIVPTILIYDRPSSPLEGKFSMPFCAAAAVIFGEVGIATFEDETIANGSVRELMERVTMKVDPEIGRGKPSLTEARVRVTLKNGRAFAQDAHGARGNPDKPAGAKELEQKFLSCCQTAVGDRAPELLALLRRLDTLPTLGDLSAIL